MCYTHGVRIIAGLILFLVVVAGAAALVDISFLRSFIPRADVLGEKKENIPAPAPTPVMPQFSLNSIFSFDHSWVTDLPADAAVTMIATGDVIPARSVNYKMVTGHGFRWPFEKTADVLSSADMTVINLETPLLSNCPITVEGMLFCSDARVTEGLTYAGIDIATLGNNHVGNHYLEGIVETKQILINAGIVPVADTPAYKEVKGTKFAFLAYNDIGAPEAGVPWAEEHKIKTDIAEARKNADIIIVSYHWGVEYVTEPTERQRYLAHFTIDNGADVVLGNHPHWVQPVELYNGKFIIYAHGNFVFDQEWSEETKLGVIGKYTFYDKKLVDVEFMPIRIVDYGQPYFLEGDARQKVLDALRIHSEYMVK